MCVGWDAEQAGCGRVALVRVSFQGPTSVEKGLTHKQKEIVLEHRNSRQAMRPGIT